MKNDRLGYTHSRYQQYYKGFKVWASDLYLHFDAAGTLSSMNGRYHPTPDISGDVIFSITREQAIDRAARLVGITADKLHVYDSEKIIYIDNAHNAHSAWYIEAGGTIAQDYKIFIDANTSEVIHYYDNIQTGTPLKGSGVDLSGRTRQLEIYKIENEYYMLDTQKNMHDGNMGDTIGDMNGIILISDAQNVEIDDFNYYYYVASNTTNQWPANAVSLAYYLSKTYDYYKTVHGRTSLDEERHNIKGIVNMGNNYNNAFWSGGLKLYCFGNGDGTTFLDWAGDLDIVAHEYSHGITQNCSNLEYQFQSGALNEAFSDFGGIMTSYFTDPQNANWLLAEDLLPASSEYTCLRDLSNPHNSRSMTSYYPAKMSEYYDLTIEEDNGGVHRNSTIPGHAFYLMSTVMSRNELEKIIYRAYIHYLTRRSQFIDLRLAAIQAANDLYPNTNLPALVGQAFDGVEIYDGNNTEPEPPNNPVSGDQFVLMVLEDSNEILSVLPNIPYQSDYLISHEIYTDNKPSITEDGSIIAYIDFDGNVNLYDVIEAENYLITDDDFWHNIAISPKADYIAMVPDPDLYPSIIGILDMTSEQMVIRELYIPTTSEDNSSITANYADILDWSIEGGWLLYDCSYYITDQYGYESEMWGVYLTSAQEDAIIGLFQPDENISVGNPSFSSTRDNVIAFDVMDYTDIYNPGYSMYTYDLFSGDFGFIYQNEYMFGHPCFSPDDQKMVFQDEDEDGVPFLSLINMQDALNADQNSVQEWIYPVRYPIWYATGSRPTSVADKTEKETPVTDYELVSNYPNPFNAETVIHYNVKEKGNIRISLFNSKGELVSRLVDETHNAGTFEVKWNATGMSSGLYFYQLESAYGICMGKCLLIK